MKTNMNVELILSIVLAVSTFFYTIINLMMWFESRATRRQKIAPLVIAYLKSTEINTNLCVCIKNIGEGCAKDVKIKVIKDYNQFNQDKYPLSNNMIFKNGANIFPPQYELKYYIDSFKNIDYFSKKSYIELEIEYSDIKNHRFKHNIFRLPFNQINSNYSDPPETYLGQLSYYLKQLSKTIEIWAKKDK